MGLSLETQEILIAFSNENKDNLASWGKYELDELQDAWAELQEAEKASEAGQHIGERIKELESGEDHLEEIKQEASVNPLDEIAKQSEPEPQPEADEPPKQNNAPYIIGGVIVALVLLVIVVLVI